MKRLAVILLVVYALVFTGFCLVALSRDAARFGDVPPAVEPLFLGPTIGYRLDYGPFLGADALRDSLASRPFETATGKRPNLGLRVFEDGYIWLRADLAALQGQAGPWTLWIDDRYARSARLILIYPDGQTRVEDWALATPDRAGLMQRTLPAFALDPARDAGATAYIAFSSFGGLKGEVFLAPEAQFEDVYAWRMMYLSFLNGVVGALAIYLGAIGLRLGEKGFLYASGMAFFLMLRNTVETGALYSMILPRNMEVADVFYYATQPVAVSFWLLFTRSFIRLKDHAPRLDQALIGIALILPVQGLLVVARGAFWHEMPFNTSAAFPTFLGLAGGFGAMFWMALRGSRRALWFSLGWLPLAIGLSLRMLSYLVTSWQPDLWIFSRMGFDLTASLLALAVILTVDLRQRERRLTLVAQANAERARDWADIGGDGVIEVAPDGAIRHAEGPLARRLNLQPARPLAEVLPGLDMARMAQGPLREVEVQAGQDGEGRALWLRLSSVPIAGEGGIPDGFRASVRDISDAVAERDLAARRNTLAAMGQLTGEIAHEVNNLLHPIISLSRRVAEKHGADAEGRRLLGLVSASGVRAAEIVRQVMRAYAPAGLSATPRPLADAVADAIDTLRASLPATITLRAEVDPALHQPEVRGGEVLQVISNLASNAVKAMDGGGDLTVSLRGKNGRAVLEVADTGAGMADDLRARVMEPFVTTGAGGIGFGLSIVRRIVMNWGAEIDIQTALGQGTRVVIRFP